MKDQTKNRIVKAYQVYKSIRKVAKILGLSYGSVHAVLKSRKALLPWSGFARVKRWRGGNRGIVTRWLERHPGTVLPPTLREIAKLVGCEVKDVHSWKTARWAKMKRLARKFVSKKIVKGWDYKRLEIHLLDGSALGAEELFSLAEKAALKELSR